MKRLFILSLFGLAVYQGMAQCHIDLFTIASGGGRSTGGVYTASLTVGETGAGTFTGAQYKLEEGFWNILAAIWRARSYGRAHQREHGVHLLAIGRKRIRSGAELKYRGLKLVASPPATDR